MYARCKCTNGVDRGKLNYDQLADIRRTRGKDLPRIEQDEAGQDRSLMVSGPSSSRLSIDNTARAPPSTSPYQLSAMDVQDQDEEAEDEIFDQEDAHRMPLITEGPRSLSLRHLLHPAPDPTQDNHRPRQSERRPPLFSDIVSKRIISAEIAESLFDL